MTLNWPISILALFGLILILLRRLQSFYQNFIVRVTTAHDASILLQHSDLSSRAKPNRRLVDAFGIRNAFTTIDECFHRDSVSEIKSQLRMSGENDWIKVSSQAKSLVTSLKSPAEKIEDLGPLEELVQNFVFRVTLSHFFKGTPEISDDFVNYLASSINSLWNASKTCASVSQEEVLKKSRNELLKCLSHIFGLCPPLDHLGDERNPLNKLLPAYETMWRVVLRCFIEVKFKSTDKTIHVALLKFFEKPTQEQFEAATPQGVSAKAIVLETLRLYPPTRRIHRFTEPIGVSSFLLHALWLVTRLVNFNAGVPNKKAHHAIDVEYLHRDPVTWGEDSLEFNPSRIKHMKKPAFMPFGKGPYICPAGNTFAPMMIGICVGALLDGFQDVGPKVWRLVDEKKLEVDFSARPAPLGNGREGLPIWSLAQMNV
ncbi:hypothetical protein BJ875DRAFT_489698 [Amylocarpus encephaloides]|uniref:Cytochrome P450 n=1 Tax=Amylocarpus encephaloides TaxID=45428 RepID=A0A9P7Y8W5_9HELO|nr:hypothetical protein BJ875DRAFT_489698 [Amylocarpus encephaloides]